MVHLDLVAHAFDHLSLAPNTVQSYQAGVNSYVSFCRYWHFPLLPLQEVILRRYVSSIGFRLAYKTIKVYLCGLQFWSIMTGFQCRLSHMVRLSYTLRGIRRWQGVSFGRIRRLPITHQHLRTIHHRLQFMQYSNYQKLLSRTACTLAFYGLLRCSEYTAPSRHYYDPAITLLVSDVTFSADDNIMLVNIKSSKTDPFRVGCIVRIARVPGVLCPVSSMQRYLRVHRTRSGPLFAMDVNSSDKTGYCYIVAEVLS